jgi:hypothetical protein
VPKIPLHQFYTSVPTFFTTSQVKIIPQGGLVLTYPYDVAPENGPMLWQMSSGFRFRIFAGEVWVPDVDNGMRSTTHAVWPLPPRLQGPFIKHRLLSSVRLLRARDVRVLQDFVLRRHVDAIIVRVHDPQAAQVESFVRSAFGPPSEIYDSVLLWNRPAPVFVQDR